MQPCHGCDSDSNSELGALFFSDFFKLFGDTFGAFVHTAFLTFDHLSIIIINPTA